MSQRLWSVTTLLGQGVPKPALLGWAVKVTAEYAIDNLDMLAAVAGKDREAALKLLKDARWRKSSEATARGSDVHRAAEQLAYGETPQVDPEIMPYVDQFSRFLDEHQPVFELAEAPVYNLTYHYAGTLDAVVTVAGRKCVLDMKTTPKRPGGADGARPPFPEVALQLAAYRRAEKVGVNPANEVTYQGRRYYQYDDTTATVPMPETDGALCLVVSPYDYQLIPVRTDVEVWTAWLYVREVARWQLDTSQKVIGPAVTPWKEVVA